MGAPCTYSSASQGRPWAVALVINREEALPSIAKAREATELDRARMMEETKLSAGRTEGETAGISWALDRKREASSSDRASTTCRALGSAGELATSLKALKTCVAA